MPPAKVHPAKALSLRLAPRRITAPLRTPSQIGTTPGSLYWVCRAVSAPFRQAWFDVDLQGLENVPSDGPVILAPNHISFLDSFVLMYGLNRKVMFMGKAEYTESVKTRIFPAAGMIPVDRSGKGIVASLKQAADVLDDGGAIGIFPEGTRSRDGFVHQGQTGAAHLAMRTGAALIPVGIGGTDIVQPPGQSFPSRGEITIRFGAPLDIGPKRGSKARREVTDNLMRSVAVLARRPYQHTLLAPGGDIATAADKADNEASARAADNEPSVMA